MSGFSLQQGQIRGALVSAGLPADAATKIANVLGNAAQSLRHSGPITHDTTPRNMRLVSPDIRRHTLPTLDFRPADADYRASQVRSSEERPQAVQANAVQESLAPQQTAGAFRVRGGAYTSVTSSGDAATVGLRVTGIGEAAFLDPQGNNVVAKNLRAEASPESEGRLRFSIERSGPEVVWKIQLQNIGTLDVVTDVRYEDGVGLVVVYERIVAWTDPSAQQRVVAIPVANVGVVTSVALSDAALVAQRGTVAVFGAGAASPNVIPITDCPE